MTKLMDDICNLRDMLIAKDVKKLCANTVKIHMLTDNVRRQVKKFGKDIEHTKLDFTSDDLTETASEIKSMLKVCEDKLKPEYNLKKIFSNEKINDNVIQDFMSPMCEYMAVRTVLTEMHSNFVYLAVFLKLFETQYEQGELEYVVVNAIREFLR